MNDSLIKAQYIVAFDEFSITDEIRNAVINNSLLPDAHLESNLLISMAKKVINGYDVSEAVEYLSSEHSKLGFYEMYNINQAEWEAVATLGLSEIAKDSTVFNKVERIMEILPSITDVAIDIALSIIVLDHLVGMGQVSQYIDYVKSLITKLSAVDTDSIVGLPPMKSLTSLLMSTN